MFLSLQTTQEIYLKHGTQKKQQKEEKQKKKKHIYIHNAGLRKQREKYDNQIWELQHLHTFNVDGCGTRNQLSAKYQRTYINDDTI